MVSTPNLGSGKETQGRVAYVLDDEAQIGAFVCEILAANGFAARQYGDALSFLAEVEANAPQLTIVDLALGHSDAVEVIRQLKTIKYRGKILLMSGRDEGTLTEINQIGKRHGLAMLLPLKKPFRASDLKLRLADLVANNQPLVAEEQAASVGTQGSAECAQRSKAKVDIEEALENHWLELWYQPKIDLRSLSICGGEALLRAKHPELGIVAPVDLLPPAGDPRYQPLSRFAQESLALLFTPPFDRAAHDPGYIKGYPPGVRENGGHYTHAALWSAMAFAALGDGEKAAALFWILNPINHARTRGDVHRYRVEPYVVAGDIYAAAGRVGRGGWTWYTGSAGWMQRTGIESILGLRVRGDRLEVDPCIPAAWPGFEVTLRRGASTYDVVVSNPNAVSRGVIAAQSDGVMLLGRPVRAPFVDDGAHHRLELTLG